MYCHPYWFNRNWLAIWFLPSIVIYVASANIQLVAGLSVCVALFVVPFYIWFGKVVKTVETSVEGVTAVTYNHTIRKFRWHDISGVEIRRHSLLSYHDYVYVYEANESGPMIFTELISDYETLLNSVQARTYVKSFGQ